MSGAMKMPINLFKQGLLSNTPQIGLWSSLASEIAAEIVALSGFDWVVIDAEHGPSHEIGMLRQLQAMAAYPVSPIIRVADNEKVLIKRALDVGAQTIIVPQIESADGARAAVRATRYPPEGTRGVGPMARTSRYGTIGNFLHEAGSQTCLITMCESSVGLEALFEISRIEGVDGIFIGPQDLAADLGYLGNPSHPEVASALMQAVNTIRSAGKPAGIMVANEKEALHWLDAGCTFVGCSSDAALLRKASHDLASSIRTQLETR